MAHQMTALAFRDIRDDLTELDVKKVSKPELGPLGFPGMEENVAIFMRQVRLISTIADSANDEILNAATNVYRKYLSLLFEISHTNPSDFAVKREMFGERIKVEWGDVLSTWPSFIGLIADHRGLLELPPDLTQHVTTIAKEAEERIRVYSEAMIAKARDEAARIVDEGRTTVTGFSVKAAQDQFDSASKPLRHKCLLWGLLSAGSYVWFIAFAFHAYHNPPIFTSDVSRGTIATSAYLTAIRITILTAIGAMLAFCLQMFRAHLQMSALNQHRRVVANSMAAFVQSAHTPEQRDHIFGRLVDAVVNFGDSGLLSKSSDSNGTFPSIAIEAITKNLSKP